MRPKMRHPGGRRGGSPDLGPFGKGFVDDDGAGGPAFGMGRKLAAADLQLLILALLAEKPRHGYEIIQALGERSEGFYRPSPGVVYPALGRVADIRLADVVADGSRKQYHLSPAGRVFLEDARPTAEALLAQFDRVRRRMERVRSVLQGAERDGAASALGKARRELEAALEAGRGSPGEEQRMADVLRRAAEEITGGRP